MNLTKALIFTLLSPHSLLLNLFYFAPSPAILQTLPHPATLQLTSARLTLLFRGDVEQTLSGTVNI